jgi:hypothetical protein
VGAEIPWKDEREGGREGGREGQRAYLEVMQSASTMVEERALMMRVMASRRLGRSLHEMVMLERASSGLSQSEGCTSTVTLEGRREGGREGGRERGRGCVGSALLGMD